MTVGDHGEAEEGVKPRLLLHTCCGPCATAVLERLAETYDTTCIFYNPNIHPESEYALRLDQARTLARRMSVQLIDVEYDAAEWFTETSGFEGEPEGGKRCEVCFRKRLKRVARIAKDMGCQVFGTTLTISPHKDAALIDRIGQEISRRTGIAFMSRDWKKGDGFKRSLELSKEYGLHRQNYCGCEYSRNPDSS